MPQKESGLTALIAAFGRAYHSQYDSPKIFDDFLAKELISPEEFADISGHMVQGFSFFCKETDQPVPDTPEQSCSGSPRFIFPPLLWPVLPIARVFCFMSSYWVLTSMLF